MGMPYSAGVHGTLLGWICIQDHEGVLVQVAHMELEAALRALSVFEILGNLHCYNEDTCTADMRELFARMLCAELRSCSLSAAGA